MDGLTLRNQLQYLLRETSTSGFLDERTSYDFLYEAACEFCDLAEALHGTGTITTVDGTSAYNLPADFSGLRIWDERNQRVVKLNDGSSDYFIPFRDYEAAYYSNNTDEVAIPDSISVTDNVTQPSNLTGTATVTGSASEAEPSLTATGATSFTTYVSVGDSIHNTTDGSSGIVIAISSATVLLTSLFYGTNNFWTIGDAFIIVPQGRKQLVVNPPSSTSGYTITVPYIQIPTPVYSDYRTYRFHPSFAPAGSRCAKLLPMIAM